MSTKNRRAKDVLEELLGPFSFGIYLCGVRTQKDMNQTQMAKFLGISKSTLCDIEKGRQLVSPKLAAAIAKKCGRPSVVAVEASLNDQLRRAGLKLVARVQDAG